MTLAAEVSIEDEELTALARRHDHTAQVVIVDDTWWLLDELGKLALGTDRIAAARDLAHYLELLESMLRL